MILRICNKKGLLVPVLAVLFLFSIETVSIAGNIVFRDKTVDIDLSDLDVYSDEVLSETSIKVLCAEIVSRYHNMGYTAFYISKAIYRKDGTLEIFFNESVVDEIRMEQDIGEPALADEIYRRGDVFNEYILRDNIVFLKKKYMLNKLTVNIIRRDDGSLLLEIHAEKKRFIYGFKFKADALRGGIGELTSGYMGNSLYTELLLDSSFGIKKVSKTDVLISSRDITNNSGIEGTVGFNVRDDSEDRYGSDFYSSRSVDLRLGWFMERKQFILAAGPSFTALCMDDYSDGGSAEVYSIRFRGGYDDRAFNLDRNDYISLIFELASGWGTLEQNLFFKSDLSGKASIPLLGGIYWVIFCSSSYTTCDERISQQYVFDGILAYRNSDYSVSGSVHSCGTGISFELMREHVYLTPEVFGGIYNTAEGAWEKTGGAGIELVLDIGILSAGFSVKKDMSGTGDIVYSVSVNGMF